MLAAIRRITNAEAAAGGAQKEPEIEQFEGANAVYNDPALAERLRAPMEAALGKKNVITTEPIMPSEDFHIHRAAVTYFSLGGADPQKYAATKGAEGALPSNHSPFFAPDVEPSLRAGIKAEVALLRDLLK